MQMNIATPVHLPDLSEFDDQSRIWLFQFDRPLSDDVCSIMFSDIKAYVDSWQSHGDKVKSACGIIANRFMFLLADEADTSVGGCSQDVMMRFIQHLQAQYKINLLDRFLINYIHEDEIITTNMHDLIKRIQNSELPADVLIFDSLVNTKYELENNWIKPLNASWVNKFL